MIKAIIFDLDNTLIDFLKMKRVSCEQAVDAMIDAGLQLSKRKALKQLYEIYYKEGLEDPHIFQKFLKKVTGTVDMKILAYGIVSYRQARTGFLNPYPRTKNTLIKLRESGLKLAIVSDAPRLKAWMRLVYMKLDDFFDFVIGFEDTNELKPSQKPFKVALRKLNVKPEECLMVGDNPDRDMKGAQNLGIQTCFAAYGYEGETPSITTDYVIKNVPGILKIIKK